MKIKMNKSGFTLVEILIVIAIVGILSVMAIGGYISYRKAALLDLNADAIVSQLSFMRDRAIHGKLINVNEENSKELKCFGVEIKKNDSDVFEIKPVIQNFLGKKKWDSRDEIKAWVYKGCENMRSFEGNVLYPEIFEVDNSVVVQEIKYKSINNQNDIRNLERLYLRFVPPNGDIEILKDNDSDYTRQAGEIFIKLYYGEASGQNAKEIKIDLSSGKITKI